MAKKKKADKELFGAVIEPKERGALQQIESACTAGADPNGICPESSSSLGYVRPGSTLLTHAIHQWSSKVVRKLLECGADPNLEDQNGWTPWMASILVEESEIEKIQESLLEFGASRSGEHIEGLIRAIANGDLNKATELIGSENDIRIISSFRVDLLRRQVSMRDAPMLEFLLQQNMTPTSIHLGVAVRARYLAGVDLLLRYGVPPEEPGDAATLLMDAAALGELGIVQRLVEAGADVNRSDPNYTGMTALLYAQQAGKHLVAEWLAERMSE